MSGVKSTFASWTGVPSSVTVPVTSTVGGPSFVALQPASAMRLSVTMIIARGADIPICHESGSDMQNCVPHLEIRIRNELPIGSRTEHLIRRVIDFVSEESCRAVGE